MFVAILVIIIVVSVGFGIYSLVDADKSSKEGQAKSKVLKQEFDQKMIDYRQLYGEPDRIIKASDFSEPFGPDGDPDYIWLDRSSMISNYLIVFDSAKKLLIKGILYNYSDITGYEIKSNDTVISTSIKTSTGSMLGRAAVGGIVAGGVGAVIGASSAKKNVDVESIRKIHITIFTKSIKNPSILITLINPEQKTVSDIDGILRIITSD